MKVQVNKESCIGCGLCVSMCSEVFFMSEGKSDVKSVKDFDESLVKECANSCPVNAIEVGE